MKLKKYFYPHDVLLLILAIPVALIFKLVRPIILFRVGMIDAGRLGHLALGPYLYLSNMKLYPPSNKTIDVFFYKDETCNKYLSEKWKNKVFICNFFEYVDRVNKWFPNYKKDFIDLYVNVENIPKLLKMPTPIILTNEEKREAKKRLDSHKIKLNDKYICVFNRDKSYLSKRFEHDFTYHDYRNADIQNYLLAAEKLTELEYQVIRMGVDVEKQLMSDNEMIFDYAYHIRDELLDLYIISNAEFVLGINSGLGALCTGLGKDIAYANVAPLFTMKDYPGSRDIFIPKKYWDVTKSRCLSLTEILNNKYELIHHAGEFSDNGIKLIENTSEEISALAFEMHSRLNQTWVEETEDIILREKYNNLIEKYNYKYSEMPQISTSYLRSNTYLLES